MYVFRRPWRDWRRVLRHAPFVLPPPAAPPPTPPVPSTIRDRRGVLLSLTDRSELSDPSATLAFKTAVRCATTSRIKLGGLQTIDGISLASGDRVLVLNQARPKNNGIYLARTGLWERAEDACNNDQLAPGTQVYVIGGALNGGKIYVLAVADPAVIGTSDLPWMVRDYPLSSLEFTIEGSGTGLAPGDLYTLEVPYTCNIVRNTVLADAVGAIEIDVYRAPFAGWPAPSSICGDSLPTLSAERKSQDAILDGWTVLLNQGDLLTAHIVSVSGLKLVTLSLLVSRN